jgi:phosphate transport system substrate-binding protein
MSQKNDTLPLLITLLLALGTLGGGAWWFFQKSDIKIGNIGDGTAVTNTPPSTVPQATQTNPFSPPSTVPQGKTIRISGSTSMVTINSALKNRFELQYPGTSVLPTAGGSSKGIADVLAGTADVAAISRPLKPEEESQGLKAIAISTDAIALVVSKDNPFSTGLTTDQVKGIFQGTITDWSMINPKDKGTIRVINRPAVSGTHQAFQELILGGGNFGNSANFTTMTQDATTPILQALGKDGISYATYAQIASQQTVRTVAVDGVTPESNLYPYLRTLYYVYKEPATPAAQTFLGFAGSPLGMETIQSAQ